MTPLIYLDNKVRIAQVETVIVEAVLVETALVKLFFLTVGQNNFCNKIPIPIDPNLNIISLSR